MMAINEISALAGAAEKSSGFLTTVVNLIKGPTKLAEEKAEFDRVINHARRDEDKKDVFHKHELATLGRSLDERSAYNLTSIIEKSEGYSEGKIDPEAEKNSDWFHRFFEYAKCVSDGSLQEIWARVLSGELEKSGSISLRTLTVLSSLSKSEAEIFSNFAEGVCHAIGGVIKFNNRSEYSKETLAALGLLNNDWATLKEIGLIDDGEAWNQTMDLSSQLNYEGLLLLIADKLIGVYNNRNPKGSITYSYIKLTKVGKEIYSICQPKLNGMYLYKFAQFNHNIQNCKTYIMEWDRKTKIFIKGELISIE